MIRIQATSDMSMLVTDEADVMFESKHVFAIFDPNTRISTLIQSEFDLAIQQNLVKGNVPFLNDLTGKLVAQHGLIGLIETCEKGASQIF